MEAAARPFSQTAGQGAAPERCTMITEPKVEAYLYKILPPRNAVLTEMERQARRRDIPIVGPAVARVLFLLAQMIGARRVFELGSAIGYSTSWWAQAVGEGGEVFYTDASPDNAREAAGYFRRLRLTARIRSITGDALQSLKQTPGQFDIIFCDLDKHLYPEALRLGLPRLRSGGLFVADNALREGKVAHPDRSAATQGILEFNRLIYRSKQLFPVILPLRDGVAVCRKA